MAFYAFTWIKYFWASNSVLAIIRRKDWRMMKKDEKDASNINVILESECIWKLCLSLDDAYET